MELSREAIVEGLQEILGPEHVVTDEQELRERSIDNFRKLEKIFGVFTLPVPALGGGSTCRPPHSAACRCRCWRTVPAPLG